MNQILKNIFSIKHLWGGLIPLHLIGLWAIYGLFVGSAPGWWWVAFLLGFILIKMLGVGAGYHRYFSHKGFEVSKWMKRFMLWCGVISAQGSAFLWVGIHRGGHHRYADTDKDPHRPKDGFWHSYILWMFKIKEGDVNVRSVVDLARDPDIVFTHKYYSEILWISNLIFAFISVDLWLYFIVLPALVTLHVFCMQTSVVHVPWMGYKNYETRDDSRNVPWLFIFTQGEAWHNNHHGDAKNPNYGGRRWWEIDPTYWLIQLIRTDR